MRRTLFISRRFGRVGMAPVEKRKRGRLSLIFGAFLAALVLGAVAYADDISNTVDGSVDAVAEVMPLNVGGADGTTRLYVVPRNRDGKSGCNLTGSTTLRVSVSSSNTSVATVSPSSITFTSCVDSSTGPLLTVTPHNAGSATISVTQTSNTTDGTFNLTTATFTVNVAPPPNTPPQVTVQGVTGGASYDKGSVPDATCQVTDAEDGNSSFAATLSAITGSYATDGIGEQTASCSYTDGGGLTATASKTYNIVDPSAPAIQSTVVGTLGDNGWYVSDVSLAWTVSEPQSPNSLQTTGCVDQNIVADQAEATYSCSASSAGGTAGPVDVPIKRDATKPTISGSASPAANAFGWNNGTVTVSFTCGDNLSGVASCGPDATLSSEGAGQSATGTAVDKAGNNDTSTVSGISIDLSDPTVTCPTTAPTFLASQLPAPVTATVTDAISGPASATATGQATNANGGTVSITGSDKAGRSTTVSCAYHVASTSFLSPIDGAPTMNIAKLGRVVPVKNTIVYDGSPVGNGSTVYVGGYSNVNCFTAATTDDLEVYAPAGSSNTGNLFRWDSTGQHWIYNYDTSAFKMQVGNCYRINVYYGGTVSNGTASGGVLVGYFMMKTTK